MFKLNLFYTILLINSIFGIYRGPEVKQIEDAPFQVSIQVINNDVIEHLCGGAILNEYTIITSANCILNTLNNHSVETIKVRSGSLLYKYGEEHDITQVRIHPQFTTDPLNYDIGLVFIKPIFEFESRIKNISLITEDIPHNANVEVYGWGVNHHGIHSSVQPLRMANLRIIQYDSCDAWFLPIKLGDTIICANNQYSYQTVSQGDSGGPVVYENQLAGIISDDTKIQASRVVFTNILKVTDFIEESIENYALKEDPMELNDEESDESTGSTIFLNNNIFNYFLCIFIIIGILC